MPNIQLPLSGMDSDDLPRTAEEIAAATVTCPCCGDDVEHEDTILHADEPHCGDCVHTCEGCGSTTIDSDEIYQANTSGYQRSPRNRTRQLCYDCSFECVDCDERFCNGADSGEDAHGDRVCASCAENYSYCGDCSSTVSNDDVQFDSDAEEYVCSSCYRERTRNRESEDSENSDDDGETVIHDHWHKPRPRFFDERAPVTGTNEPMPGVPYFGVEFEVDSPDRIPGGNEAAAINAGLHPNPFYHCESDGSLVHGFEIVSKPATWAHWQTVNLAWMGHLKAAGYRSYDTRTCGQHIHVSRAFLSEAEQFALVAFVKHNSLVMRRLSRRDRFEYCKLGHYKNMAAYEITLKLKAGDSGERYEAINLCNKSTLEFRLFRGTLCPKGFRRNLSLVVALVHFVKWAKDGRHSWLDAQFFAKWVRTKGRKVLGTDDAKTLSTWIEAAVVGTVAADVAA